MWEPGDRPSDQTRWWPEKATGPRPLKDHGKSSYWRGEHPETAQPPEALTPPLVSPWTSWPPIPSHARCRLSLIRGQPVANQDGAAPWHASEADLVDRRAAHRAHPSSSFVLAFLEPPLGNWRRRAGKAWPETPCVHLADPNPNARHRAAQDGPGYIPVLGGSYRPWRVPETFISAAVAV